MLKKYLTVLLVSWTLLNLLTILNHTQLSCPLQGSAPLPPLYVITPTYTRAAQRAELTRVSQALAGLPNVTWIVVEDSQHFTDKVTELLSRVSIQSGDLLIRFDAEFVFVSAVQLLGPMPPEQKNLQWKKQPKGVTNRNRALEWIMENATEGVFYFADDDNTYDSRIFDLIR